MSLDANKTEGQPAEQTQGNVQSNAYKEDAAMERKWHTVKELRLVHFTQVIL